MKFWLGEKLRDELSGLVYHVAMEEDGTACYVSFITHKAMREAKSKLSQARFSQGGTNDEQQVKVTTEDITRTELVATALNISLTDDAIPPLSFFLSKFAIVKNLVIMMFVWLITVFNFYLVCFLVNTFDQIFMSVIASGVSEFAAQAAGGMLYERIGARLSLSICFAISAIGGFAMLLYGLDHQEE